MRFMPGEIALPDRRPVLGLGAWPTSSSRTSAWCKTGAKARSRSTPIPTRRFDGKITYIYPTLKRRDAHGAGAHRAGQSRAAAQARHVRAGRAAGRRARRQVVTVPVSAVIDSGTRAVVLVQRGEGRFEPREVKLGARSDNYVEVRRGVQGRRAGGGRRQLPDRCRKQSEGGARRLGRQVRRGEAGGDGGAPTAGRPPGRRHGGRDRCQGRHGHASATARWPASSGRR